jgi:TonB family protein
MIQDMTSIRNASFLRGVNKCICACLLVATNVYAALAACAPITIVGSKYPHAARSARIQGLVRVSVMIAEDGSVKDIQINTGHPVLGRFVRSELRHWKFGTQEPASGDCSAFEMTWSFRLIGYCDDAPRCDSRFVLVYPNEVTITSQIPRIQP